MKKKYTMKHALAAALTAAQVAALTIALPAPKAEAADFSLGSGFTDPTITVATMYYWKEGVPPVVGLNGGKTEGSTLGKEFPLLIVWDDQYYFNPTVPAGVNEIENGDNNASKLLAIKNPNALNHDDNNYNQPHETQYDRGLPAGYIAKMRDYKKNCNSLFGALDVAQSLKENGVAASMDVPTDLYVVPTESGRYGLELGRGSNKWLFGELHFHNNSRGERGYDNSLDWFLNTRTVDMKDFIDPRYNLPVRQAVATNVPDYSGKEQIDLSHRTWTFVKADDGQYSIGTDGTASWYVENWASSIVDEWRKTTQDFVNGGIWNWTEMWMCHDFEWKAMNLDEALAQLFGAEIPEKSSGALQTMGVNNGDWSHAQANGMPNFKFRVFYGEPNLVSFIQTDTRVQDGQVVNLDGPIVIGQNATITVEEGGVLVVSGWVMNGGFIMVKPGGMLIVQDQERLDGTYQYGVINCYQETANKKYGRISCDGIMIVNRDCKVFGAGAYGLQFGEGAQCINYGQLVSENFEVYTDHTIENRGDVSAVYAGWGLVNNGGYAMANKKMTMGATFPNQGTVEKASSVKLAKDAVYGDGANRVYINTASKVSKQTGMANRKGYVTDVEPFSATYTPKLDTANNIYYITDSENYRYDWYDGIQSFARFEYANGTLTRYDFGGRYVMPAGADRQSRPANVADYDAGRNSFFVKNGDDTYWYNGEKGGFLDESALTDVYYPGTAILPAGVKGASITKNGGDGGATGDVLEDGAVYAIETGLKAGMVLDVYGASMDDGGNVQLFENNGNTNKQWRMQSAGSETKNGQTVNYYKFINVNSGKALSVESSTYSNGVNVAQYTLRDIGDYQKWRLIPDGDGYTIVPKPNESLALDVSGGNSGNRANIQLYEINGTDAQRWKLIKVN